MPGKPRRVYWDSSVFLSLFQRGSTPESAYQREQAIHLLEEARNGTTLIITSTFTLAEARRGEGVPPLPGEEHATLNAFFKHSYIEAVPVDRAIGELAAEYGERFNLSPADAVQLATAVRVKVPIFLAWDGDFHRRDAMKGAPIPIEKPKWTGAKQLALDDTGADREEEPS